MNTNDLDDRRDYFRIDDQAEFAYYVLSAEESSQYADTARMNEALFANQHALEHFNLMQKIQSTEGEAGNLIRKIYRFNADLIEYLKLQDQKIQWFMHSFYQAYQRPLQPINIGLGGVGFTTDKPLKAGTRLKIKLVFQPDFYGMFCLASVIESLPLEDDPSKYRISTQFLNVHDKDIQFLNKHMFELQIRKRNEAL